MNFLLLADTLSPALVRNTPVILDQYESEELLWQEYVWNGSFLQKVFASLNLKKVEGLQKRLLKNMDVVLCVSEIETNFMKSRAFDGMEVLDGAQRGKYWILSLC